MSKLSQLKKTWDYEPSVPRCAVCVNFRESHIRLTTNSQTIRTNHHCASGGFTVNRTGVCRNWTGADGSKLEAA